MLERLYGVPRLCQNKNGKKQIVMFTFGHSTLQQVNTRCLINVCRTEYIMISINLDRGRAEITAHMRKREKQPLTSESWPGTHNSPI